MEKMKGREEEWKYVKQYLFNPLTEKVNKGHIIPSGRHLAIMGDRGIGKSLLLNRIANECKDNGIITIYASIDPSISVGQLAGRLASSFQQTLDLEHPKRAIKIRKALEGVRIMGTGLDRSADEIASIEAFCFRLVKSIRVPLENDTKVNYYYGKAKSWLFGKNFLSGVVIIIDEIDSANNKELPIGATLKTIIEYLDFHGIEVVSLVIAGLSYMRDMIYDTHPSAWRVFTKTELKALDDKFRKELIKSTLDNEWTDIKKNYPRLLVPPTIRSDAENSIAKISKGYPHWISLLTISVVKKYVEDGNKNGVITLNDLALSKEAAFKKIWEDYYTSDYNSLSGFAKNLLRLIALHPHHEVKLDLLKEVSQIPSDVFENVLSDLIKKQIIELNPDLGIHEYVKIRSQPYRNWVPQFMHPLLDPIGVSDIWNEEEGLPFPTIIAGEDSTAFKSFIELVKAYVSSDQSVQDKPYDAMKQLFSSFSDRAAVVEFRNKFGMKDRMPGNTSSGDENKKSFFKIWDDCDIVAIPHYFLGKASMRGIWTFDELLPGYGEKARKYFSYVLHNYSEACQFKGSWVAIPFSFVSKVLVSKEDIETPKNWDNLNKRDGKIPLHLDSCPDDISLWYEWHHLIDNSKWYLLERSATDQNPTVSQEAIDLTAKCKELSAKEDKTIEQCIRGSSYFSSIASFASLIEKVEDDGFGNSGWKDSEKFNEENDCFMRKFTYKSIWVDFAAELQNKAKRDKRPLYWYELPSLNGGEYSQPLESWVFVIPKKNNSKFHHENAKKWAKFLVSTMSMGWQLEFQRTGGCSPINTLAKSAGIRYSQPWTDYVANVIKKAHDNKEGKLTNLRGKSHHEIEIMQLEIAFLTFMYFERDKDSESGYKVANLNDDEILSRFTKAFPALIEGLKRICVEN